MEDLHSLVDEFASFEDERIQEIEEDIGPVSGTVMEISDRPGYVTARRVGSEVFKNNAESLSDRYGPEMTTGALEGIETMLREVMTLSENFYRVNDRRFSDYNASDYSHEDHVLMVSAAQMAEKLVENRLEYDAEMDERRPDRREKPVTRHRWR